MTSRRESTISLLAIAGLWLTLASWNSWLLMRKPYWMDELCCTVFALRDATTPAQLFGYVSRYDVAPPLLHLLAWPIAKLGGYDPPVIRSLTLACAILAVWVLYVLLRRRFGRMASAGAIVGVASHTLLLHHAFDARFYGPWLLFAVAYAWVLDLDAGAPSRRRDVLLALLAVCLSTIQWLGVTSLFLLAAGAVAAHGGRWRTGLRLVAPSVAGVLAFVLLLPMMLAQRRQGGESLLWVPAFSGMQLLQMAQLFLLRVPVVIAVALLVLDRMLPARLRHKGARTPIAEVLRDPGMAALLATILMPLVLAFVSVVLAPVMVPRYAVISLLAAAPVIALSLQLLGRVGYAAIVAVFAGWVVGFADKELGYARYTDTLIREYKRDFTGAHALHPTVPIVFNSYFNLYMVDGTSRRQSVARVMELSDSAIASLFPDASQIEDKRRITVNRAAVRVHQRIFGFPQAVSHARMDSMPRFFFFATDDDLPFGYQNVLAFGQRLFPHHRARRMTNIVTLFERTATR